MNNPFNISTLVDHGTPVDIDTVAGIGTRQTFNLSDIHPDTKKDYIVVVKPGLTITELEQELEQDTSDNNNVDSNIIPDRPVEVADRRPGSQRQTHYWLTDLEAARLGNDPRILTVVWNPHSDPTKTIRTATTTHQNFERAGLFGPSGDDRANFALYRCTHTTNPYGTGAGGYGDYTYILDGTGVDVVIMDSGVQTDHPEWLDNQGASRFQEIDWYAAAGIPGTMPSNFYSIPGGHATHVAGIIAGRTFGWARNAHIFSMNVLGADPIDSSTGFDLIINWHRNKPNDPATGRPRPTVVNSSWVWTQQIMSSGGSYDPYEGNTVYVGNQIWGGNYRGTPWSGYTMHADDYALKGTPVATYPNGSDTVSVLYSLNTPQLAQDALVSDLIQAGIHYVHAAGNDGTKSDNPLGPDYDNYVNIITNIVFGTPILTPFYYNRPSSPGNPESINVGSISALSYDVDLESRAYYSNNGTAIDIYAPGTGIVSAYKTGEGVPYYWNNSYDQYNDSGTSMASPQVAGVLALYLQYSRTATTSTARQWLLTTAITTALHNTGLDNDYSDTTSLTGGPDRFLYMPLLNIGSFTLSGAFTMTNISLVFR